jgi:hypothetical protein
MSGRAGEREICKNEGLSDKRINFSIVICFLPLSRSPAPPLILPPLSRSPLRGSKEKTTTSFTAMLYFPRFG